MNLKTECPRCGRSIKATTASFEEIICPSCQFVFSLGTITPEDQAKIDQLALDAGKLLRKNNGRKKRK